LNKPDDQELRQRLTEVQYKVTQGHGTEPAFTGELNDNKRDGRYSCIVCEAHLFDSESKFDSGRRIDAGICCMRYQIDPTTGLPLAETSPGMLGATVFLALLIGIGLLYIGKLGKQLWIVVWSAGLIICSVLYLIWHFFTYVISSG